MKWIPGRQGTGYDVLTIFKSNLLKADCYLIRYNDGAFIPPHMDKVESGRHFRINIVLKRPRLGGKFVCPNAMINWGWLNYFRPDIQEHWVSQCVGTRIVFSLGWIRK